MAYSEVAIDLEATIVPSPTPVRGCGFVINTLSCDDGEYMIYPSGKNVVIRDIVDRVAGVVFTGHKANVGVAAFSPNGELVASADKSGKLKIWNRTTLKLKHDIGCPAGPYDITWSPDSKRVIVVGIGSGSCRMVFLDVSGKSARPVMTFDGHTKPVLSISYQPIEPHSIVSCGENMHVVCHNGPTWESRQTFSHTHSGFANCIRFSPQGTRAVSVSSDKKIKIWNYEGKELSDGVDITAKKRMHAGSVYQVSWSPCGNFILTASADKSCYIWNVDEKAITQKFQFEKKLITNMQMGCAWHKAADDTEYLISINLAGNISYLNPETGAMETLFGISDPPSAITYEKESKTIYMGTSKGGFRSFNRNEAWKSLDDQKGSPIVDVSCSSNGNKLYAVTKAKRWMAVETKGDMEFSDNVLDLGSWPTSVSASSTDPDLCAVSLSNGNVVVIKDAAIISQQEVKGEATCVQWNHDDTLLAVGTKKGILHTFNVETKGDEVKFTPSGVAFKTSKREIMSIQFTDKVVSTSSQSGMIMVYNPSSGETLNNRGGNWKSHNSIVPSHSWNPSFTHCASVGADLNLIIWKDASRYTNRRNQKDRVHTSGGMFVTWISDDELLTVGNSGLAKYWKITSS